MRVLIDTHIAIGAIWENMIKHMIHPEKVIIVGDTPAQSCENTGFKVLPILNQHTFALKMNFLTHDSLIPYYFGFLRYTRLS